MWGLGALRRMNDDYSAVVDKAKAVRRKSYASARSWAGTGPDSIGPGAKTLLPWPSLGWQRAELVVARAIMLAILFGALLMLAPIWGTETTL